MEGLWKSPMTSPIECFFCGEPLSPWISSPIDPKTKKMTAYGSAAICVKCDIAAITPQPSAAEIPQFYKLDNYYTRGRDHFEEVKLTMADRVLGKLAWHFDRGYQNWLEDIQFRFSRPGSVCDLGCGSGGYLLGLIEYGWTATGVEPDPVARVLLSSRGVDVYDGTAEMLPKAISDNRFDLVIATHVLEHCLNPTLAIENASGLLKPGGYLLVEVPNKDCVHFETFGAGSECYDAPRHLFFFGPSSLRRLVV
jgi:SAM-dependent methyltransferase